MGVRLLVPLVAVFQVFFVTGTRLTFQIPDKEKQCYYEDFKKGAGFGIFFYVEAGGHGNVDFDVQDPNQAFIHKETQQDWGQFYWNATLAGPYQICFSTELPSVTNRLIYLDVFSTDSVPVDIQETHITITLLETASMTIYETLEKLQETQTHFRLRENGGRMFAEYLHARVFYWSIGEVVIVFFTGIGQVLFMKSFFTDKKLTPGQ